MLLIFLTLLQHVVADKATDGDEVSIMVVGSSITQGGKPSFCYREHLIQILAEREAGGRFVHPNKDQLSHTAASATAT